jgi:tRNA A-37 threonylcarbamoyl transferase component Bud32
MPTQPPDKPERASPDSSSSPSRDVEATNYTDQPRDREATNYKVAAPVDPRGTTGPPADLQATNYTGQPTPPEGVAVEGQASGSVPRRTGRRLPCRFGGYELLEELGRGGMGIVYKARQVAAHRLVALKTILAGQLTSDDAIERFRREATATAGLDHPGIVPVFEVGAIDGEHFFSMALVHGGSLQERLRDGPLPPKQAAEIVLRVAEAVQHAHDHGIIHRDLKPANILLATPAAAGGQSVGPGGQAASTLEKVATAVPKLTDFGLARTSESSLSATGEAMGTPSYMPPEQARGHKERIGVRSDVYGLGAVLYCALTGRPPFQSDSVLQTLYQVLHEEPVSPRRLNAAVPSDLETICLKCLEKEPEKRYGSAGEMAEDLGRYLRGEPIKARPMGMVGRTVRWARRQPAQAALVALGIVTLAVGIGSVLWIAQQAEAGRRAALESAHREEGLRKTAVEKQNEAEAKGNELQKSNDELLTSVARGLLAPLGLQSHEKGSPVGVVDGEIEALWELAVSKEDRLRLRFVEHGTKRRTTTRRLKSRAAFAMHAAVGLDVYRREAVEQMMAKQMSAALPWEQRTDVALMLAALGDLSPQTACSAAATLTEAISKTTAPDALRALAKGLSAVAARLDTKEAAAACTKAAATLTEAIGKTTAPFALGALAEGLSAVAARLDTKEAKEAAATLTEAISKTTNPYALRALAQGLSAVLTDGGPLSQSQQAVAVVGTPAHGNGVLATLTLCCSALEPPRCRLDTPDLVELLKSPLCVGDARRLVLDALGLRYKRHFANQWELVHVAQQQNLGLDFTTPPQRLSSQASSPQ